MKLIYVASPYAGDIETNTQFAKKACRFVMNEGYAFFAPHLLYPQVLDEDNPDERQLGLNMGKEILGWCDELWVNVKFFIMLSHSLTVLQKSINRT